MSVANANPLLTPDRYVTLKYQARRCDYCGGSRSYAWSIEWVIEGCRSWGEDPAVVIRCLDGCPKQPEPQILSLEAWMQTGFSSSDYGRIANVPPSSNFNTRCDHCGRSLGFVHPRFFGTLVTIIACQRCQRRLDGPEEFPTYVGWDGKEHGEYWG